MNKSFDNVNEYIATFTPEMRDILESIRKVIKEVAPEAEEMIAYGMPAYKIHGKPLVYFAGFTKHIGLYPLPQVIEEFKAELSKYKQGKGSVQFLINQPMPLKLIKEIVKFRVNQILK